MTNESTTAILKECRSALACAEDALRSSYQVCDYPANGNSDQDHALANVRSTKGRLDEFLARLEQSND